MWLIPILVLGAIAIAAASKSPREAPPSRQIAAPVAAGAPPGLPGPISVLGEILRIGQYPSPTVILCAIAEAEAIGRRDIASDIVSVFVAPIVYRHQHQLPSARPARLPSHLMPSAPAAYERGSCALPLPRSPRAQADARASCAPISCAPPAPAAVPAAPPVPQVAARQPTEDELIAMLHTDPAAFVSMVESQRQRRGPLVEIFPVGTRPSTGVAEPSASPAVPPAAAASSPLVPAAPPSTANANALAEQLLQLPGHAGSGVTLVDPSTGVEVFEVRWLRGYPVPPLPQAIDGRAVRLVVVDSLPVAQPTGLPSETVAQMQETAGLPEAADQTRSLAPGSPLEGVSDEGWRQFVMRLARESPTYNSSRHVGQYRQRRERLAELGIDPRAIYGSATAQRAALDADLADAHRRLAETGDLQTHLGRQIAVPGTDTMHTATLSGILGVVQCAGLDGAVGWLERSSDRRRYPHTTQVFLNTNGAF